MSDDDPDEYELAADAVIAHLEAEIERLRALQIVDADGHPVTQGIFNATTANNDRNMAELNLHRSKARDEYWAWQGDGTDYPKSLTCPVLISADDLRDFIARSDAWDASLADLS